MKVQDFLNERGVTFETIAHAEAYDAQRMAQAVHTSGHHVAKTVLLKANGGYTFVVAVLPATSQVDLEKAREALGGGILELATERDIVEHCPDCEAGALPPFGSQYGMRTLVDKCFAEDEEIVFEGNTHREAIRMTFEAFHHLEEPLIASFARHS